VNDSIIEWCNGASLCALYSEFGWPTTSAAKKGGMELGLPIWDVQFLKRKFSPDEHLGLSVVHSRIDESVITDLLVWMRVNCRTVIREQLLDNVNSAMQFAFPYGEQYYEQLREKINKIMARHHMVPYMIDYDNMRECMLAERFGVYECDDVVSLSKKLSLSYEGMGMP